LIFAELCDIFYLEIVGYSVLLKMAENNVALQGNRIDRR